MSGFRVARGGAQELYGIKPDLSTFGKIIGGGLPVGAYGGRREIMEMIAPSGPVYQAGTLSGNPLAMAAGIETLRVIDEDPDFYQKLDASGAYLEDGLRSAMNDLGIGHTLNRVGSMFTLFFTTKPVTDFSSAKTSDTGRFSTYFRHMLEKGVYLPPSQFEACFISAAHSTADLDKTIAAIRNCEMTISIGDSFSRSRLVTDELIRQFAVLSGDHNPIHLDEEFAKTTRFGKRIAHGMLTGAFISAVLGYEFAERRIVYLSQTMKFIAPVFIGDTLP